MSVSIETIVETLNKHRTALIGFAWVVVGDAQLADDVFQDVSLAAIRKCEQIQDPDHLISWLRHAIRLRGLEMRRNLGRQVPVMSPEVLDLFESASSKSSRVNESDRMSSLRQCIDAMPDRSRELLSLRYSHDLKPAEIAAKTRRSEPAIYKAIARIHLALAQCVKQRLKIMGVRS